VHAGNDSVQVVIPAFLQLLPAVKVNEDLGNRIRRRCQFELRPKLPLVQPSWEQRAYKVTKTRRNPNQKSDVQYNASKIWDLN